MPVPDRDWLLSRRPMSEVEVDLDMTRGLVGGGRFEACTGESVPREDLRGLPCMIGYIVVVCNTIEHVHL